MEHVYIGERVYGVWLEDDQMWTPELVNNLELFIQKWFDFPNQTMEEIWSEQQI